MAVSQYTLREVLGEGKFAKVYKGYKNSKPEEVLAIKVLNLEKLLSPPPVGHGQTYRKYWIREIEVMKALQGLCPNIVCLDDIESDGDKEARIAMEYCDKDLKSFLVDPANKNKQRTLTEKDAQICMRQLANAFKHMCGVAIAHRDLKPQNILVSTHADGSFVLKVSDFGFARPMERDTAMQASLLGTPLYMAPEIYQRSYSDSCDLWSLGIILYELLFGFHVLYSKNEEFKKGKVKTVLEGTNLSEDCKNLLIQLLQPNPKFRISMLDFFSHPFIVEPHPEASLLSHDQLSQLEKTNNSIQVFVFPTLETFTLEFDDRLSVFEWKAKNKRDEGNGEGGLLESDLLVLCRDATAHETGTREGVELVDYEILEKYQMCMGSPNKCVFVFRKNIAINQTDLLPELPSPAKMDFSLMKESSFDDLFARCKAHVIELNNGINKAYEICSKFVLVRELILYALRALCTVTKTKKDDLEGDIQKTLANVEQKRKRWQDLKVAYTQTCAYIEMMPARPLPLPEFLRPKASVITELLNNKNKEMEHLSQQLKSIDEALVVAKQKLVLHLPGSISIDEKLKAFLNRDFYEYKKNAEHFRCNFEVASNINTEKCEAEERQALETLLQFTAVLTEKVHLFHAKCKENVPQAVEIANQVNNVLTQCNMLSNLSTPDSSEGYAIPKIELAINNFNESLNSIAAFNDLPNLHGEVTALLEERQKYDRMISIVAPRAGNMLQTIYNRYNNLTAKYEANKQQIDLLFQNFSQLSELPRPTVSVNPEPSLHKYPEIRGISSPSEIDQESEQFSLIFGDQMSPADLMRDNELCMGKLRAAEKELRELRARTRSLEDRTAVGSEDLARKVKLYERMTSMQNLKEKNIFEGKLKEAEDKLQQQAETQEKQKAVEETTIQNLKKELEETTKKNQAANSNVTMLQQTIAEVRAHASVEAAALREEREKIRAIAEEVDTLRAQAQEAATLRAQVQELESLRAQVSELTSLKAQIAQETEARRNAEEVSQALTTQVALMRDTIMAYEISYQDIQPPVPPT